jgi:hypothetical protein
MIQDFVYLCILIHCTCTSVFYRKPHLYFCMHFGLIVLLFTLFFNIIFHNKLLLEHEDIINN